MQHYRSFESLSGSLLLMTLIGCSAAIDDGEPSGPPTYSGTAPGPGNSSAPGNSGASLGSSPAGMANLPGGEGQTGGVPLTDANSAAGGSSSTMMGSGAGGSASTPQGTGGSAAASGGSQGASGSAQGASGASMLPPDDPDEVTPEPPIEPPVTLPPVTPPDVPFEGRGCAAGAAFFCEDFEALPIGTAQANAAWTPSVNNGTLSIDGAMARGTRSLHVQTQGNGRAYIALAGFAPPNNSFFARMYVRAEAFPRAPDYAHFTLVEAAGAGAGVIRPIGGQYIPGQGTLWGAGSDRGPTGDWTNWRPTAPVEAGRFLCIEWEMTSANNAINVWLDEVAKPELSVSTRSHGGNQVDFVFPRFNSLWIGWELYQGGPTPNQFNFWFDDIVLSTERVGC